MPRIPIIDLFAGPGGLGEGFSSVLNAKGERAFKIKLSVEKDEHAHRTLELRAFFREFAPNNVPVDYYTYLRGEISRDELYKRYPDAAFQAKKEAWKAELGNESTPDELVDKRINEALAGSAKWLLIGGPPCQAYSLVGRSRVIGGEGIKKYEEDPRHRLYLHYLRILAVHQPPIFVMENVKGLLSARVNKESIFDRILADLRSPWAAITFDQINATRRDVQYNLASLVVSNDDPLDDLKPKDFVVCTENFGIPQARHRIIIIGIRSDLAGKPDLLSPEMSPSVEEVIGDLPRVRSGLRPRCIFLVRRNRPPTSEHNPEKWSQLVSLYDDIRSQQAAQVRIVDVDNNSNLEDAISSVINSIGDDLARDNSQSKV